MSREKTIKEMEYVFNTYNNYTDLRSWSEEISRLASEGVNRGVISAREAHSLSHVGHI